MKHAEVWLVNFSPSVGQEIRKARPAIVVNDDNYGRLAVRIIVPVTGDEGLDHVWHVKLKPAAANGLTKRSVADCLQLKSSSTSRFIRKIGRLSDNEMAQVKLTIAKMLNLA